MGDDVVAVTHFTPGLVLIYVLMLVLIGIAWRRPRAPVTFNLVLPLLAAMVLISTTIDSGLPSFLTEGLDICRETPINSRMNLAVFVTIGYVFVRHMMGGSGASTDVERNGALAGAKEGSARDADHKEPH